MKEVWKIIEEYPNYSVSNLGRVKRLKSNGYNIILRPIDDGKGYRKVHLFKEGKSKLYLIHRLVAQALFLTLIICLTSITKMRIGLIIEWRILNGVLLSITLNIVLVRRYCS